MKFAFTTAPWRGVLRRQLRRMFVDLVEGWSARVRAATELVDDEGGRQPTTIFGVDAPYDIDEHGRPSSPSVAESSNHDDCRSERFICPREGLK
jgi:hypothetical protein